METEAITEKVTRRFSRNDDNKKRKADDTSDSADESSKGNGKSSNGSGKQYNIPFVPSFLFKSFDSVTKKNVRKWRDLTNAGRVMVKSDMASAGEDDKSDEQDKPPGKEHKKKKVKKQRRLTTTVASGVPDDTVEVKLDTDDEEYSNSLIPRSNIIDPTRHDSKIIQEPDHSTQDVRVIRRNTSVGMRAPHLFVGGGGVRRIV